MSKLAMLGSGTGVVAGAGTVVVCAVAAAGYFGGFFTPESEAVVQTAPAVSTAVPVQPGVPAVPEAAQAEVAAPRFDLVRVERDGSAMIAGAAAAGSSVSIRLDDELVAEVSADASGNFASFLTLPESAVPRVLTLETKGGDAGTQQVIIAPAAEVAPAPVAVPEMKDTATAEGEMIAAAPVVEPASDVPEAAEPAEGKTVAVTEDAPVEIAQDDVASGAVEAVASPVQPAPSQPETTQAPEQPAPRAPSVLIATNDGARVLQAPDAMTSLLGAISYDDGGDVALTGRAEGAFVRVYLDNAPVTTSRIEQSGDWRVALPDVASGVYTLRVDELNAQGDVVARVETPFKRETADALQAATLTDAPVQAITVQPGATLWAIARDRYGSGTLYTRVVEANADAIRNPDLIYPGQVFAIPN